MIAHVGRILLCALAALGCGTSHTHGADGGRDVGGARDVSIPRIDSGSDGDSRDVAVDTLIEFDAGRCDTGRAGICGEAGEALWSDTDMCSFAQVSPFMALDFTLVDTVPATPYFEVRRGSEFVPGPTSRIASVGAACLGAMDPAACNTAIAAATADGVTGGFGAGCAPLDCADYVIVNRGDDVTTLNTAAQVVSWLAPIDSPTEAAMIAWANGHAFGYRDRSISGVRPAPGGWELLLGRLTSACLPVTIDRVLAHIDFDGNFTVLRQNQFESCAACI